MTSTGPAGVTLHTEQLGALHWVGVLAALVSAAVHLLLGFRMLPSVLGVSFVLAGLGFLAGVGLVVLGRYRRVVYAAGIPFTLAQIVLWYVLNFADGSKVFPADIGALGVVDKLVQVVLVVVLVVLLARRESRV
jgi:hypothetical protein